MERTEDRPALGVTMRTQCGRKIAVGRLLIGEEDDEDPVGRIVLRINCMRAESDQLWASLTPGEARLLARRLLAQAEAVRSRTRGRRRRAPGAATRAANGAGTPRGLR